MHGYEIEVTNDTDAASDVKKRINNLKELYDAGIITNEEFQQRRKDIIDEATK